MDSESVCLDNIKEEDTIVKAESREEEGKVDHEAENDEVEEKKGLNCPDCEAWFELEDDLKVHFQQNHIDKDVSNIHICVFRLYGVPLIVFQSRKQVD